MKTLLALILTAAIAAGQTTGDYLLTRKAATGYTQKTLTPENGKSLGWDSSGNPVNIAPVTSLSWDAISSKPTTISGYGITDAVITSQLSSSGGTSTPIKTDGNGNLLLAPLRSDATAQSVNALDGYNGNLLMADDKFVGWAASDLAGTGNYGFGHLGRIYAGIRYDRSHDTGHGEWNFDSYGRVCWYWQGGYQMGDANGGTHTVYFHSGYASAGNTLRQSVPIRFNTSTWTGGTYAFNPIGIQARPLDLSGTNSELAIYRNMESDPSVQDQDSTTAVKIASISNAGIWSNGTAPALDTLTDGATITQTCSKWKTVQAAKVTLGGARTLAISGALAGMRGVIYVAQDATGGRTLTLPTGSATPTGWTQSTLGNKVDRWSWEFDGTYYYWTQTNGINLPLDTDAINFISAASITDDTQKTAINNLVLSLKAASLWTKFDAIYPFVGGNATAHSKDLKGSYNVTWSGTPTHNANGVTGNGTDAWGNTGIALSAISGRQDNCRLYVYCKTQSPSDAHFIGATDASSRRLGIGRTGSYAGFWGMNSGGNPTQVWAQSDFRMHLAFDRTSSTLQQFYMNSTAANANASSTGACTTTIGLLCRNTQGSPDYFSGVNLAFATIGASFDSTEEATFRAIVDTFQTTLGRKNP